MNLCREKDTLNKELVEIKVYTIGVYGYTADEFFDALKNNGIEVFFDIRRRRGMRLSKYNFVNSMRLQEKLKEQGIEYIYLKELAPTQDMREKQKLEDQRMNIKKTNRSTLGNAFIDAYSKECLSKFDVNKFMKDFSKYKASVFFCVEAEPRACHRYLVAEMLKREINVEVEHIIK